MPRKKLSGGRRQVKLNKNDFKIELDSHVAREVSAIAYFGVAIISLLFITGNAGILGNFVDTYLRLLFGKGALMAPVFFLGLSLTLFMSRRIRFDATRNFGIMLMIFASLGLLHMQTPVGSMLDNVEQFGGYAGFITSVLLRLFISDLGAKVVMATMLVIGGLITFEISLGQILGMVMPNEAPVKAKAGANARAKAKTEKLNIVKPTTTTKVEVNKPKDFKKLSINKPEPVKKKKAEMKMDTNTDYSDWELPSLDLLSKDRSEVSVSDKVLHANAQHIQEKLAQFSIPVEMKDVNIGPTVMQYTLQPDPGVKLNKISALKNDLAMTLAAKSIRIEAPIPGKSLVGVEVPNDKRMVVHLREILESQEFSSVDSKLKVAIGRDVSGAPVIDDLASMPHLLIAGATGSGKSVGMNTFLLSLLYQNSPEDLKFIMVDPKRVELSSYNGIPHLLTPVITTPEKAYMALKWAVQEMNRRYQELSEKRYRNIEEYNAQEEKRMPKIVIVIDELADLMMQANKKETEAMICRIAQMARAVGMHLILATQRPSVNVITGLIKANIPTRIAFTVTSGIDSRTIIDSVGAEDLLGMGDMLYLPGNMGQPIRVQGIYVSTKEIQRVTNRLKINGGPAYNDEITETKSTGPVDLLSTGGEGDAAGAGDDMYEDAIDVIKSTGKASASLLQRRLSVGYARAARLLDILEEQGMIGPANGAKAREIYITNE